MTKIKNIKNLLTIIIIILLVIAGIFTIAKQLKKDKEIKQQTSSNQTSSVLETAKDLDASSTRKISQSSSTVLQKTIAPVLSYRSAKIPYEFADPLILTSTSPDKFTFQIASNCNWVEKISTWSDVRPTTWGMRKVSPELQTLLAKCLLMNPVENTITVYRNGIKLMELKAFPMETPTLTFAVTSDEQESPRSPSLYTKVEKFTEGAANAVESNPKYSDRGVFYDTFRNELVEVRGEGSIKGYKETLNNDFEFEIINGPYRWDSDKQVPQTKVIVRKAGKVIYEHNLKENEHYAERAEVYGFPSNGYYGFENEYYFDRDYISHRYKVLVEVTGQNPIRKLINVKTGDIEDFSL